MDTKKVIEINNNIREARDRQIEYLKQISEYMQEIMGECPHELVVKIHDNHPRKMLIDGSYYCPACDMMLFNLPSYRNLSETEFKNSKILDLAELSLLCDKDTLDTIKSEVLKNYDGFLNGSDLDSLKEALKTKEYDYNRRSGLMKKVLKPDN